jgi:hypothetical protein
MSVLIFLLIVIDVVEIFTPYRDLEILCIDVFGVYDMYTLEMYAIYPLRSCLNFHACYILVNF